MSGDSGFFCLDEESFNNIVVTIIREHHWPPETIGGLFCDNIDWQGMEFIYDDIVEVQKELSKKK